MRLAARRAQVQVREAARCGISLFLPQLERSQGRSFSLPLNHWFTVPNIGSQRLCDTLRREPRSPFLAGYGRRGFSLR